MPTRSVDAAEGSSLYWRFLPRFCTWEPTLIARMYLSGIVLWLILVLGHGWIRARRES